MVRTVLEYCIPGVRKLLYHVACTGIVHAHDTVGIHQPMVRTVLYCTMQPHTYDTVVMHRGKKAITKFIMVNKQMNQITNNYKTTIEHSPEMRGRQGGKNEAKKEERK